MMAGPSKKRLIVSIHDVGPRFEDEVDRLVALLERLLGGARFAMLVVPDHWGQAPLSQAPQYQAKLRGWSEAGVEMFVHGWFHRDHSDHSGLASLKAGLMTAREGEFLGLSASAAARRMADGKALVEDIIGKPAAGFIAPAWLYGDGARDALAASGFALAEDHMRVWRPQSGEAVAKGPVITWATRSVMRRASSLAVAAVARNFFHGMGTCRIAVHPGDTKVASTTASIEATVANFALRRPVGRYADLLSGGSVG